MNRCGQRATKFLECFAQENGKKGIDNEYFSNRRRPWGDEGKDGSWTISPSRADIVIRYQGGDNAGHTVITEKGKFALHIIPSGIFNPKPPISSGRTVDNFDHNGPRSSIP
jgi:hypothetical protein